MTHLDRSSLPNKALQPTAKAATELRRYESDHADIDHPKSMKPESLTLTATHL